MNCHMTFLLSEGGSTYIHKINYGKVFLSKGDLIFERTK